MRGFAAVDKDGMIFVRTVSDMEFHVKLNTIVLIGHMQVQDGTPKDIINEVCDLVCKIYDISIREVEVTLVED